MESDQNKNRLFSRRDSGEIRALAIGLFCIVALSFSWSGLSLIQNGALGNWSITSSFKGWTLYITSISPGLMVFLLATAILIFGLPRVLKNL